MTPIYESVWRSGSLENGALWEEHLVGCWERHLLMNCGLGWVEESLCGLCELGVIGFGSRQSNCECKGSCKVLYIYMSRLSFHMLNYTGWNWEYLYYLSAATRVVITQVECMELWIVGLWLRANPVGNSRSLLRVCLHTILICVLAWCVCVSI